MPVKGSDLEEDFSGSAQGCEAVQTKALTGILVSARSSTELPFQNDTNSS